MILVTGASGLLGANFLHASLEKRTPAVGVFHNNPIQIPGVKTVHADLNSENEVQELLDTFKPKWIVHCAALTDVDWCENHPEETRKANVEAPRYLAKHAARTGSRLIYISTGAVFDGKGSHYTETDPPLPVSIYGKSKLEGEKAVLSQNPSSIVVRCDIYGWKLHGRKNLAEWALSELESGKEIQGFTDAIFTPILVNHLSETLFELMEKKASGVVHVGGSTTCSKYEFICELAEVFGLDRGKVKPVSSSLKVPRPLNTSFDCSKVIRFLGHGMPDLRSGLLFFKSLRDSGFLTELKNWRGL